MSIYVGSITKPFARLAVAFSTAAALTVVGGPAEAAPAWDAVAAEPPCGFSENQVGRWVIAMYNHCGPTTVRIHVDVAGGGSGNDREPCVNPGVTRLGLGAEILNAYYIGDAGCVPRIAVRSGVG